jgi:hypothetical protein
LSRHIVAGTCHCGAIAWWFAGDPGSATACNCTICRRYGKLWIYDWEGERISVIGGPGSVRPHPMAMHMERDETCRKRRVIPG